MAKKALITGITGQDGAYLAELLLKKGYIVHGVKRRSSSFNTGRIDHLYQDPHVDNKNFILHYGDLTDSTNLIRIVQQVQPDEIYNLGAQSHVQVSFETPEYTANADAVGVLRLLEAIRILGLEKKTKFYQASTSELYGLVQEVPQSEKTPFYPRSPYGVAKLYGYWITVNYRESYGMFACNGILFNHESPLRGETFVTRKITRGAARIALGIDDCLYLGNLDAQRDWGHAKDYCIDLDTEILTASGFKRREDLSVGDVVINYNINTLKWEYDTIIDIYDIPYEGDMYHFKGNNLSFRCSENHRLYYKRKTRAHKAWNDLKWQETTAKDIFDLLKDKNLRTKYDFCFPGMDGLADEIPDYAIEDNMIMLIGYLLTEGCWFFSKKIGGGAELSVSQSKKKYFNELKEIIDGLNLEYRLRERPDELCEFIFTSDSKNRIVDYFDDYDIHRMPSIVFSFSKRQLEILFKAMMNADGSWAQFTYISANKRLLSDFQTIASLIGYKASFHRRKSGVYEACVFSKAKKSVNNFITEATKETVAENIWCVKTGRNGTIITRKDDSIFVSGNCEGMWRILQHHRPDDFVLATGRTTAIRDFVRLAFKEVGVTLHFEGVGAAEKGIVTEALDDRYAFRPGQVVVQVDSRYFRPAEVDLLIGDASKAKRELGWEPHCTLEEMVKEMVASDLAAHT